jgi:hypothetical protein
MLEAALVCCGMLLPGLVHSPTQLICTCIWPFPACPTDPAARSPALLTCPADLLLPCRLKGHFLPYNSGLLAREALSHPFFGAGRVKHARVPEQLDAAFPPAEA